MKIHDRGPAQTTPSTAPPLGHDDVVRFDDLNDIRIIIDSGFSQLRFEFVPDVADLDHGAEQAGWEDQMKGGVGVGQFDRYRRLIATDDHATPGLLFVRPFGLQPNRRATAHSLSKNLLRCFDIKIGWGNHQSCEGGCHDYFLRRSMRRSWWAMNRESLRCSRASRCSPHGRRTSATRCESLLSITRLCRTDPGMKKLFPTPGNVKVR